MGSGDTVTGLRARPRCVIAGCGYVGRRLAVRLAPTRDVLALVRTEARAAELRRDGLQTRVVDFDAGGHWPDLEAGLDGAWLAYLAPPPESGHGDPRLDRFLAGIAGARPSALLYMSTTGVYGDAAGAWVTEESAASPRTERAHRRLAAEHAATAWASERGCRCVILRVPGIYGPGRLPLERLRKGSPVIAEDDSGPGNRIQVDDLVGACLAAFTSGATGVFNVTDGTTCSTTRYMQRVAALAGLPAPPEVSREEARVRLGAGMMSFLDESRRVSNRRMIEQLGYTPRYADLDEGIRASLAAPD